MINFFKKIKEWYKLKVEEIERKREEEKRAEEERRKKEEEKKRIEEERRKREEEKNREVAREILFEILTSKGGEEAIKILWHLVNSADFSIPCGILDERIPKVRQGILNLLEKGIIQERVEYGHRPMYVKKYALTGSFIKLVPAFLEILKESWVKTVPKLKSKDAKNEFSEILKMDKEFDNYLRDLLRNRLEETIKFGRNFNIKVLADYLKGLFGEFLYFDSLLAISQQYGIADTEIMNDKGKIFGHTGFHLALFGAPGTGKTFAIKDLILGNEREGVKAHGLPGRNRYCGGMTPSKFLRIGEAYQGRKFNFIVAEFNDWFKWGRMVEPLKLALEQGEIRVETREESIGPYRFNSFFSVNYNTEIGTGMEYEVTISDPNFNAIEDRMLVRLHKMTKERYEELKKAQRKLAMGEMKFNLADKIRDHLTLVYAIQIGHPLVREKFPKKKILISKDFWDSLDKASNLILKEFHLEHLPFSIRLEKRAIQLAGTFSLLSYFAQNVLWGGTPILEVHKDEKDLALKFFIEEVAIRLKREIYVNKILSQIYSNVI